MNRRCLLLLTIIFIFISGCGGASSINVNEQPDEVIAPAPTATSLPAPSTSDSDSESESYLDKEEWEVWILNDFSWAPKDDNYWIIEVAASPEYYDLSAPLVTRLVGDGSFQVTANAFGADFVFIMNQFGGLSYMPAKVETKYNLFDETPGRVGVICRYTGRQWYEFNVLANTNWTIEIAENVNEAVHNTEVLASGRVPDDLRDKSTHTLTGLCLEDKLALYIDGVLMEGSQIKESTIKEWGHLGIAVTALTDDSFMVEFKYVQGEVIEE